MKKLVALCSLLFVVSACGGGGDRPTTADVTRALEDKDNAVAQQFTAEFGDLLDSDTIACIAKVLHDSDVSDDTLEAIVEGDADYKGTDKEADALKDASTGMAECITG